MDQGGGIGNGEKIDEGDQLERYLGVNSHRTWWISCGRVVGGNIMVPVFLCTCGHLEFLWDLSTFLLSYLYMLITSTHCLGKEGIQIHCQGAFCISHVSSGCAAR